MYIFDKQSIIFHVIRICTCVHEAGENKIPAYKQIHETESSRKERNSNLELYRIIVMLLIVAHHYVVNSGLMSVMKEEPLHIQSIFLYLFGMWGKTGINCFVMITGYFMCKSHISLRKFMKLLFEIYFYNLIITGTFLLTGYCSPSFSTVFSVSIITCVLSFCGSTCIVIGVTVVSLSIGMNSVSSILAACSAEEFFPPFSSG